MNNYEYVLNNIVPADDLFWEETEKKYVALSKEETENIILSCMKIGLDDFEDIYKMINWCSKIRIGNILWKNFISGSIMINDFDEEDEPRFSAILRGENEDYN